nr:MAG TPA: Repressor protein CI [Caudoviricetes sp.]
MTDEEQKKVFAKNLNKYLSMYNKTQKEVADAIGVIPQTFNSWCTGQSLPRMGKVQALADYFGINKSDLIDEKPASNIFDIKNIMPMPQMKKVPLLGTIACGEPIMADENIECYVSVPDHIHADFCLRCQGDSMINARIFDGDIVYIHKQPIVENGEIAAVLIEDEATLKRVYIYPDKIILQPENPLYAPKVYVQEEMNDIEILGKAIYFTSLVR